MSHALEYDLDPVLHFVQLRVPGLSRSDDMRAIGLRHDGEMVAGVLYEGFNGRNLWMHVAAVEGRRWLTREYLRACFAYPFNLCRVDRISGYVNASNRDACRFNLGLGFTEETRLRGAAPDGGDVILFVMWRKDCRHVTLAHQ